MASAIRKALDRATANRSWLIRAEVLKVSSGLGEKTVYIDLVEEDSGQQRAKMRGIIWPSNGTRILQELDGQADQVLTAGSEIVFEARIQFHERFGLSLFIERIDLRFMLGEMERRKQATVQELQTMRALGLNKRLLVPTAPQRIALVGSPGTSGFRDFVAKSLCHPSKRRVHIRAFAASVQGKNAPQELMDALDAAEAYQPDLIFMVRGGGSNLDLDCFNDLQLCIRISQLSIPLWTGIGHESDLVVADLVAHSVWKTPTDAADALIRTLDDCMAELVVCSQKLAQSSASCLAENRAELEHFQQQIEWISRHGIREKNIALQSLKRDFARLGHWIVQAAHQDLERLYTHIERSSIVTFRSAQRELHQFQSGPFRLTQQRLLRESERLHQMALSLDTLHPDRTLKRGFSMIRQNGVIVGPLEVLNPGDTVEIETHSLRAQAVIKDVSKKQHKN